MNEPLRKVHRRPDSELRAVADHSPLSRQSRSVSRPRPVSQQQEYSADNNRRMEKIEPSSGCVDLLKRYQQIRQSQREKLKARRNISIERSPQPKKEEVQAEKIDTKDLKLIKRNFMACQRRHITPLLLRRRSENVIDQVLPLRDREDYPLLRKQIVLSKRFKGKQVPQQGGHQRAQDSPPNIITVEQLKELRSII